MKLKLISNNPNIPIHWNSDRLSEIQKKYPLAKCMPSGLIMISTGKNYVSWLDPFALDITFHPFQSFSKFIRKQYDYSPEDVVSQLSYGDRNVRPFDEYTHTMCKYNNLSRGFNKHSSWQSHIKDTQTKRGQDKIEHNKMRICFAYNRALAIAKKHSIMYLYVAKLKSASDIKFGITQYQDLNIRKLCGHGEFDGTDYDKMALLAYGDAKTICQLERDYKLLSLNVNERISKNELLNLKEFALQYSPNITICDISGFICR